MQLRETQSQERTSVAMIQVVLDSCVNLVQFLNSMIDSACNARRISQRTESVGDS